MRRFVGVLLIGTLSGGGDTSQPIVGTALPIGSTVQLRVTDAGRATLSESMGPSVDMVEGRLVSRDSAAWTLSVTAVHLLRGGQQVWSGERVRIRAEQVALASEKKFSRSRTALVSAAALGVVVAVAKGGLNGLLQGEDGKAPPDTVATVRIPRP
jgi:hypothetical protein